MPGERRRAAHLGLTEVNSGAAGALLHPHRLLAVLSHHPGVNDGLPNTPPNEFLRPPGAKRSSSAKQMNGLQQARFTAGVGAQDDIQNRPWFQDGIFDDAKIVDLEPGQAHGRRDRRVIGRGRRGRS